MLKLKKRPLLCLSGVSGTMLILLLSTAPTWGFNPSSLISTFLNPWLFQAQNLQNQLLNQLNSLLNQSAGSFFGMLGLPDISRIQGTLDGQYSHQGDFSGIDEATHEVVRQTTYGKADGTLSTWGQQQVLQKLDTADQTAMAIEAEAQYAQNATVTQHVLKHIAWQNVQQGRLTSALITELTDTSVKQDIANLNLANISAGVDSQNLARQIDSEGIGNGLINKFALFKMF